MQILCFGDRLPARLVSALVHLQETARDADLAEVLAYFAAHDMASEIVREG